MLISMHVVKVCAHCYTWSEALCSLLYMERSIMLITIHGVKRYVQCY